MYVLVESIDLSTERLMRLVSSPEIKNILKESYLKRKVMINEICLLVIQSNKMETGNLRRPVIPLPLSPVYIIKVSRN